MKNISVAIFLIFICTQLQASSKDFKPLPNWIDHSVEKIKISKYPEQRPTVAPPSSFRLVPEYAPAQAVVLGWRGFTTMLEEIAKYAVNDGNVEIWAASGPDTISGIPVKRYMPMNCALDTVWIRDYGPFGIIEDKSTLAIVDPIYRHYQYRIRDDRVPTCIAREQNIESFPMDLILDGGNLMVDSAGNLFMTKRTYIWNRSKSKNEVDQLLKDYFNVKKIHAIDYAGYPNGPTDGTGHIDMFVKLLNDNTVLISTANNEPYIKTVESAVKYFESIKAPNGEDYKIIRVKGWTSGRTWYTYTNSLIVNGIVIMPSYRAYSKENLAAVKAYEQGMPGIKVKTVNSDYSISSGGAIHCITQLIPEL